MFGDDSVSEKVFSKLTQIILQPCKRVFLPKGRAKTWQEFYFENKENTTHLVSLIDAAQSVTTKYNSGKNEISPGRFGFQPVDVAGAFHNGFLYYPVKTIENVEDRYRDEQGNRVSQIATKIEIVLIRSDWTIQIVSQVPALCGTPLEGRVLRLSDDTLIESPPKSSIYSTWSWDSVQTFCACKGKTHPLGEILKDVKDFLKESVWLPFQQDYDLLTLLVSVTFAQAIFQSVPRSFPFDENPKWESVIWIGRQLREQGYRGCQRRVFPEVFIRQICANLSVE